jgi:TusA-related sulfurtransferase
MTSDLNPDELTPQALLEFYSISESAGSTCALLTPAIKAKLQELASGQVLEVHVDDPSAKEDILSWSRLSGNQVLAMFVDEPQRLRFYLRKK